jgi:hypothetical protein
MNKSLSKSKILAVLYHSLVANILEILLLLLLDEITLQQIRYTGVEMIFVLS